MTFGEVEPGLDMPFGVLLGRVAYKLRESGFDPLLDLDSDTNNQTFVTGSV